MEKNSEKVVLTEEFKEKICDSICVHLFKANKQVISQRTLEAICRQCVLNEGK